MIIFLDIDGVIATMESYSNPSAGPALILSPGRFPDCLDRTCIDSLNWLVDALGADIVISSSWRHMHAFPELCDMLKAAGLKGKVIGKTPVDKLYRGRGWEILDWRFRNRSREPYMVLDDEIGDIVKVIPADNIYHIKDGFRTGGLTKARAEEALAKAKSKLHATVGSKP